MLRFKSASIRLLRHIHVILFLFSLACTSAQAQSIPVAEYVITVVIDGARYSETLGDPTKTYTPEMWKLSTEGTLVSTFYNDKYTYTSRAVPALWCGGWTEVTDTVYNGSKTQYTELPSIFEYVRKKDQLREEECVYVIKEIKSLWLPSFDPDYGENYWPMFHSVGATDTDVAAEALKVIDTLHPKYLNIYFADVDHAGHSGVWEDYIRAIGIADSLVGVIWNAVQSDSVYGNKTAMFITNDHGRHDDQHGGFKGHGNGCDGCRHIQFLAIGKGIKKNYVSDIVRNTPDFAVTAAAALGITMEKATGSVMEEIFEPVSVAEGKKLPQDFKLYDIYPNPFNPTAQIRIDVYNSAEFTIDLWNASGEMVSKIFSGELNKGTHGFTISPQNTASGIYYLRTVSDNLQVVKKIVYLR